MAPPRVVGNSSVRSSPKALSSVHNIYLWKSPAKILEVYIDSYSEGKIFNKSSSRDFKNVRKLTAQKGINDK